MNTSNRQKRVSKTFSSIWNRVICLIGIVLFGIAVHAASDSPELQEFRRLQVEANNVNPAAMRAVGEAYRDGRIVARNYTTAAQWYRKAAEAGDTEAERMLGICYFRGFGLAASAANAEHWLRRSSDHGNAAAQFYLAYVLDAAGKEREAMEQWAKAAHNGNVAAQTTAGFILLESDQWENQKEGVAWLRKAAEKGDSSAQWRLGKFLDESIDVSRNREEAISWYRKSAEQGNRDARERLVKMGVSNVLPADYLTCTTLGFPVKIPIPTGYEPGDSVKQAFLEMESSLLGDAILLPVLYRSKDLVNPIPFTNSSQFRLMFSPRRKESFCRDAETWTLMKNSFLESSALPRNVSLSGTTSMQLGETDDINLKPISGTGWVGRFSTLGVRSDNPLDVLKGGIQFSGIARIRDRVVAITASAPIESPQISFSQFPTIVDSFLSRLYELNKDP